MNSAILHLHCGDSSADALRAGGVDGEIATWFDPVLDGPVPDVDDARFLELRAQYWLDNPAIPFDSIDAAMTARTAHDQVLHRFPDFDEVVFWFDACLFDQTILLHHLDWISRHDAGETRFFLICVGDHPAVESFHGLGQLSPKQLAALLDQRRPIDDPMLELGVRAWAAYRSSDPSAITDLLAGDCSALPYLAPALHRHLERFPSVQNGLNRLQQEILRSLKNGPMAFGALFQAVSAQEQPAFFGDGPLIDELRRLSNPPKPALTINDPARPVSDWVMSITEQGRALERGEADWLMLAGIDRWLGGCHLKQDTWRWDRETNGLLFSNSGLL